MPYCSNCGTQVQPGDKFCNNCGAGLRPVAPPQPTQFTPTPPPPVTPSVQQGGEEVVIAITGLKKPKSFGRWDTFNLLATPQRVIIAPLTKDAMNKAIMEARDKAKAEGKGFFGQWGAQLGTSFRYADRFIGWTPEAVLADNPGSQVLLNDHVEAVSLSSFHKRRSDDMDEVSYKLEISARGGSYKYELDNLDEQLQGFHQLFGGRFKTNVRFGGGFSLTIG